MKAKRTGATRTKGQRALDLVDLARMLREGMSQAQISQVLGISPAQVCKDARKLTRQLNEVKFQDAEEHRLHLAERLAWARTQAKEGWDRSTKPKEKVVVEERDVEGEDGPSVKTKTIKTVEGQAGDPGFLNAFLKADQQEARLFGLEAPLKVEARTVSVNFTQAAAGPGDQGESVNEAIARVVQARLARSGTDDAPPLNAITPSLPLNGTHGHPANGANGTHGPHPAE